MNKNYTSLLVIYGIIRLVNSQNYSLGLYVEEGPTYIYKNVLHARLSFSLHIPDFVNDQESVRLLTQSENLIESVNISTLYESDERHSNLVSVFKTIADISNTFQTFQEKL